MGGGDDNVITQSLQSNYNYKTSEVKLQMGGTQKETKINKLSRRREEASNGRINTTFPED